MKYMKPPKRLTKLQKRKRLERSRRDARRRLIKKHQPLCVNQGFIEYAYNKKWDDETTDAAALIMHFWFVSPRKKFRNDEWLPLPYQKLKGTFGKHYVKIVNSLIELGFLERNEKYRYVPGHHCYHYRICEELRNGKITASYYLKSETLQIQFIANKNYWKLMPKATRLKHLNMNFDSYFKEKDSDIKDNHKPHCKFIKKQTEVYKKLIANAHLLEIDIDDATLSEIAKNRYAEKNTDKYDFEAYKQRVFNKVESTQEIKYKIDDYGRIHVPITNIMRELWDYVLLDKRQISAVDIKSSHVYCLLALLKDIDIHYFSSNGTHEERLANCQLSEQIKMIPGLTEHLRRSNRIYQAKEYFKYMQNTPENTNMMTEESVTLFINTTKSCNNLINTIHKSYKSINVRKSIVNNNASFIQYLQINHNITINHKQSQLQTYKTAININNNDPADWGGRGYLDKKGG